MHMRVYNPAAPARAAPQRQQWTPVLRVSRTAFPQLPRPSPHLLPPFFFSSTSSWVPFCPACGLVCAVRARGCRSRAQVRLGTVVLALRRRGCRPASRFGAPSPIVSVSARPCLCACLCACVSFRPPGRPHPLFFFLPHCSGCRWRSAICLTGWSGTGGAAVMEVRGRGFPFVVVCAVLPWRIDVYIVWRVGGKYKGLVCPVLAWFSFPLSFRFAPSFSFRSITFSSFLLH